MGSVQSAEEREEDEEEDEEDQMARRDSETSSMKVLEQEPEILPCHSSATPLSPQLSTAGTPRLGPSIKVWDPYNVLAPPQVFSRSFSLESVGKEDRTVEIFLINHGECGVNLRPDLVGGRWPAAALTANGNRQARALAVFLKSQGVRFNAVYSSPLDRAKATAASVCQELNFSEEQIQFSDALIEMSQGQWEGCLRSETYTPEMVTLIDRSQPDFSAPSGESLRQVEFRMIQFLNSIVLQTPQKPRSGDQSLHQNETKGFSRHSSQSLAGNSVQDRDGSALPQWDLLHRHRQGLPRKKSGKSRLQFVTTGDNETEDDFSVANHGDPHELISGRLFCSSIGFFSHAMPIKCLLMGLLGCSPAMSNRICIDDSSMTVLHHSLQTGWQLKRLNDTAHLRLL